MLRQFDETDRQIIGLLKENARYSVSQLARSTQKPRTTIAERIQRLETEGVLKGYTARVDHEAMGSGQTVFLMLQSKEPGGCDEIAQRLGRLAGVEEAHVVTGEWDIVLKVRTRDLGTLYDLQKRMHGQAGIKRIVSLPSAKTIKDGA